MFAIDAQSGNITTLDAVEFTTSAEIKLVVLATDQGVNPLSSSTAVIIRPAEVNLHDPVIVVQSFVDDDIGNFFTVAENSPENTFIAHVLVSDSDYGRAGEVECFLEAENDDDAGNFHLVSLVTHAVVSSYQPYEFKLVTGRRFDREHRYMYETSLACRDFGDPARWVRRSIPVEVTDVDDNAPVFGATSYNFTVAENGPRGQIIGRVSASDADEGPNARVTYLLGSDSESSSWFDIDPSSGVITARVSFDREFVDRFQLHVIASSASTTSTSQVRASLHQSSHVDRILLWRI